MNPCMAAVLSSWEETISWEEVFVASELPAPEDNRLRELSCEPSAASIPARINLRDLSLGLESEVTEFTPHLYVPIPFMRKFPHFFFFSKRTNQTWNYLVIRLERI